MSIVLTQQIELKEKIEKSLDEVNSTPVVFKWTYKLDEVTV